MKKILLTCLTVAALFPVRAQLFSPESLSGAFWGSWIGGLAGGDCRNGFSGEGAAIGAGIGVLAGAIAGETRRGNYYEPAGYAFTPASSVSTGYGYSGGGRSAYVYYAPNSAPSYYYRPSRPNYAVGGTLLGAASGALIGAGTHDAGKGAAIGAAAGLVLGGVAEASAQRRERRANAVFQSTSSPQMPAQSQAPEALSQYQITSRRAVTSTYYWTTQPQIADAPRVPEAPTF